MSIIKDGKTYGVETKIIKGGGGSSDLVTIEVTNEELESGEWTNYRIHQDVLLPLVNEGKEMQVKMVNRSEWNTEVKYFRTKNQYIPKTPYESGAYIEVRFDQYPYNQEAQQWLRFMGEPREDGYYYPEVNGLEPKRPSVYYVNDESRTDYGSFFHIISWYCISANNWDERPYCSFIENIDMSGREVYEYQYTGSTKDFEGWYWDVPEGQTGTGTLMLSGLDKDGKKRNVKITCHIKDGETTGTTEFITE